MRLFLFLLLAMTGCSEYADMPSFPVSGSVEICSGALPDVRLTISNAEYGTKSISTDDTGRFIINGVPDGEYTLKPSMKGVTFNPPSRLVRVSNGAVDGQDFITVVSWEKFGEGLRNSEPYSIYQTIDCGYLIAGYKDDSTLSTEDNDMWVIKTDMRGITEWEYLSNEIGNDFASGAAEDAAGNIVVSGYLSAQNKGDSVLMRFIPGAGGSWFEDATVTLGGGFDECGYSLDRQSDGAFILGGNATGLNGNLNDLWLARYDFATGVTSTITYELQDSSEACRSVRQVRESDGAQYYYGYVIGGERWSGDDYEAMVVRTDSNFTKSWERYFRLGGTNRVNKCAQVTQSFDNYFMASGSTAATIVTESDMWTARFDAGGEKIWERVFDYGGHETASAICQGSDGAFYLGGSVYRKGTDETDIVIVKIDRDGNTVWKRELNGGEGSRDEIKSMILSSDGSLTVAATKTAFGSNVKLLWLLKFDVEGNL